VDRLAIAASHLASPIASALSLPQARGLGRSVHQAAWHVCRPSTPFFCVAASVADEFSKATNIRLQHTASPTACATAAPKPNCQEHHPLDSGGAGDGNEAEIGTLACFNPTRRRPVPDHGDAAVHESHLADDNGLGRAAAGTRPSSRKRKSRSQRISSTRPSSRKRKSRSQRIMASTPRCSNSQGKG